MRAWRAAVLGCGLMVGCGGALVEEPRPLETETAGAEAAAECRPEVGEARRVKTLLPPSQYHAWFAEMPESFVAFHGLLHFAVNFEDGPAALWRSDGTEEGTVPVKEFPLAPDFFPHVEALTPAGDRLFFVASEAATGQELWVSDGTSGGTHLVEDLTPGPTGSWLSHLTGLGRTLVFFREDSTPGPTPEPLELWRSDGSAEGTERLLALDPGTSRSFNTLTLGGTLLFFTQSASHGTELWKTDGTAAGTARVRRLDAEETYISAVRASGGTGFFTLIDADSSTEVWRTDGTRAGTVRLRTFGPHVSAELLGAIGPHLYLTLTESATQRMELYRLHADGRREYVASVPNPSASLPEALPYVANVSAADGRIFFSIGISSTGPAPRDTQLWVTDGTKAGTRLLHRPLSLSDEYGSPVYAAGSRLAFFTASGADGAGIEPWVTDGTAGGTRQLRDVAPGDSSYPRAFLRVGSHVFFNAYDETRAGQLWVVPLLNACLP
jgi:ELWxxDGT repeat protein